MRLDQIVPLLAASWVEFVIFLIIVGSSMVGQVMKTMQQKAEAERRRRMAESLRQSPRGPQRSPVDREVDEFTRRGSERGRTPPPVPATAVKPNSSRAQKQAKQNQKQRANAKRSSDPVGRVVTPSASLGAELSQADERLESHLQQTFDHRLGQLSGTTSRVEEGTDASFSHGDSLPPAAARVRALLASPQDLPAAFVLSEILRRPEERWKD